MVGRAGPAGARDAGARSIAGRWLLKRAGDAGARAAKGPLGVKLAAPAAVAEAITSAGGGEGGHAARFGFGLSRRHGQAAPFHAGQRATHARAVAGRIAARAIHATACEAFVGGGASVAVLLLGKTGLVAGAIASGHANAVTLRATGAAPGAAGVTAQAPARDDRPRHTSALGIAGSELARDPVGTRCGLADGAHDGDRTLARTVAEAGATTDARGAARRLARVGGERRTMTGLSDLIAGLANAIASGVAADAIDTMTRGAAETARARARMNRPVRRIALIHRAIDAGGRDIRENVRRLARVQGGEGLGGGVFPGRGRVGRVGPLRGRRRRPVRATRGGVHGHGRGAPGAGAIDVHLVEAASEGRSAQPKEENHRRSTTPRVHDGN